jgi:CheY-like chemotaxis protein
MQKKIILGDNSKTFLMYVGLLLKRLDCRVIPADDGVECLRLLKLTQPDAVLLDVYMPQTGGLEVLKCMKDDQQTASIPVIMVGTDAIPGVVKQCMDLGAYAYLTKPVRIDRLYSVLQECFFAASGEMLLSDFMRRRQQSREMVSCR